MLLFSKSIDYDMIAKMHLRFIYRFL